MSLVPEFVVLDQSWEGVESEPALRADESLSGWDVLLGLLVEVLGHATIPGVYHVSARFWARLSRRYSFAAALHSWQRQRPER